MKEYTIEELEKLVGKEQLRKIFNEYYFERVVKEGSNIEEIDDIKINHVTHEPFEPINFPDGHVGVYPVEETEIPECSFIRIHDSIHYLHDTTTYELYKMIGSYFEERKKVYDLLGINFDFS